jgi:hypothetical protein
MVSIRGCGQVIVIFFKILISMLIKLGVKYKGVRTISESSGQCCYTKVQLRLSFVLL